MIVAYLWYIADIAERNVEVSLCEKCPYSELFWSVFSRIRTKYEKILRISPYSVRIRENMDQNNSKYGDFLHSVYDQVNPFQTNVALCIDAVTL